MPRKQETNIQDRIRKKAHNFIDLTGQKFNKLLVLGLYDTNNNGTYWLCRCDCGKEKIVNAAHLKDGHTKSCGCIKKNYKAERSPSYKHGLRHTRLYEIWVNMKTRCYNSNNERYKDYGNRGITICNEWLDKENGFMSFYNWSIANGYRDDLTIDRIDVNGNYEPDNCRWVTMKEQQNNRTNNFVIEYKNKKHTLQEWSEILPINISSSLLRYRILSGWNIEDAFTKPIRRFKNK